MKLEKNLPEYEVLTKHNMDEYSEHDDYEAYAEAWVAEQEEKLEELGLHHSGTSYLIHFFDSPYSDDEVCITELSDAIQMLAIKDGYDFVKFENGRAGFVASYNCNLNGFEILGDPDDLFDVYCDMLDEAEEDDEIVYRFNDNYSYHENFYSFIEDEDNLRLLVERYTEDPDKYDYLYEFVPLTDDMYEQAQTRDYNEAVERLEYNGHVMIERCLADCCEVIANNTNSDKEAFDRIIEGGDMMYPLSEWGRKAQFDIYLQWLEHFNHPIKPRTTEEQMKCYIERRKRHDRK